jgi:hypothetical protein
MPTETQETIEMRCEACFGTGRIMEMKSPRLGHKIVAPPECMTCNGTGRRGDKGTFFPGLVTADR